MYERMLNKSSKPSIEELIAYCGENAERFTYLNNWLSETYGTEQKIVFPYGNKYGWGISHRKKQKLICNIFAENNAFSVMIRMANESYGAVYGQLKEYTQRCIDNKYPCGNGGWLHYRVLYKEHLEDIQIILNKKLSY